MRVSRLHLDGTRTSFRAAPAATGRPAAAGLAAVALTLFLGLACGPASDGSNVAAEADQKPPTAEAETPPREAPPAEARSAAAPPADGSAFSLGRGFVVWESSRSGDWRLWTRRLDGSGLRQLSPDQPRRQHCCPHISPDGRWVSYLSSRQGRNDYPEQGVVGALHLIRPDGSEARRVVDAARSYFENRAVVWRDPGRLIFISEEGYTMELDLATGGTTRLTAQPADGRGWLLNSTLSHATSGVPTFSPYDPERRAILPRSDLGGCQPYFSHDGRWGFWTAGAGGPLYKIDLATRQVKPILGKQDPRMREGFVYAYFPMLSADGLLFAYAASRGWHDHFRANYEVFVAETDPETLELLGRPVRYSFHEGADRFPDIYLEPLDLGRHFGEAPLRLRWTAPGDAERWSWSFGDGATAEGAVGEHVYRQAGRYDVEARAGEDLLLGHVVVREARPPRVETVELPGNGREVVVYFDEEVECREPTIEFTSGRRVVDWSLGAEQRSLRIALAENFRGLDHLLLDGIWDLAQQPNRMPPVTLDIEPPLWPSRRDGLVFLWETGDAPNLVFDPQLGAERTVALESEQLAHLNHDWAMVLGGGYFWADREKAAHLREAIQGTNELTVEATVRPDDSIQPQGQANIISYSGGRQGQNFTLFTRRDRLFISLRLAARGRKADSQVELVRLPRGNASHVVVSYRPGNLACYLDGELVLESEVLRDDFFNWKDYPLIFGDDWGGGARWLGTLEGIAFYNRFMSAEEARENYLRYRAAMERRPEVPRLVVEATLRRKSPVPTLEEISPYREALTVFEYEIESVLSGEPPPGKTIRVAHWSILDGRPLPVNNLSPGTSRRLELEPFADNPQVASLFVADTLESDGSGPLYFAMHP